MVSPGLTLCLLPVAISLVSAGLMLWLMPVLVRALRLERRNFAGESIGSGYGLVVWIPASIALGWSATRGLPGAAPAATALVLFGLVGLVDDLWGDRNVGGFRGHLRELAERGRVTTGLIKLTVGAGAALALGLWLAGDAAPPLLRVLLEPSAPSSESLPPLPDLAPGPPPAWAGMVQVLAGAAVIALGANTVNLFDLRPLRALKLFGIGAALLLVGVGVFELAAGRLSSWKSAMGAGTVLHPGPPPAATLVSPAAGWRYWVRPVFLSAGPLAGGWIAAGLLTPALVAAAVVAPLEAQRRVMLGDTGANALGAFLGVAACVLLPPAALVLLAVLLAALNLYAESHSLSALIRAHPLLDRLDRWGWRADEGVKE